MSIRLRPQVHYVDLVTDFLEHSMRDNASTITLVVCTTRDDFVQQIYASIELQSTDASNDDIHGTQSTTTHSLLANTIGSIVSSNRIKLAFCPSLEHLRAYLSVFRGYTGGPPFSAAKEGRYQGQPVLTILNIVALHYHTGELSAQGLSRTLALAVEVAAREMVKLGVCECAALREGEAASGSSVWDADIPLLNSSIDTSTEENRSRPTRTVKVKQVAQRWFDFC
ncbi:hypothetical protein AJ80_01323 [Polytolypa hystricis UAMH7299]|uniref:Uncharacterized protein n=1 Tax=Polytolypa hystricis (strain UAMH7299) TaxID=1447883 RepID=A0A2B7Z0U4_POLH7|nr:hypothetical protein AJ80_01323 [Polytolypa hystricis UAMH7299]